MATTAGTSCAVVSASRPALRRPWPRSAPPVPVAAPSLRAWAPQAFAPLLAATARAAHPDLVVHEGMFEHWAPGEPYDAVLALHVAEHVDDPVALLAHLRTWVRPGGRLGITDILAEDHLTPAQRLGRGGQAGCIAGAPSVTEYRDGLTRAGFTSITITPTHQVADGVHAAIIRAARP